MKTIDDLIDKAYRIHEHYHIYPNIYEHNGYIAVDIERGHYRYDHEYSDDIMVGMGGEEHDGELYGPESSEDDYYSEIKYYSFRNYEARQDFEVNGKYYCNVKLRYKKKACKR